MQVTTFHLRGMVGEVTFVPTALKRSLILKYSIINVSVKEQKKILRCKLSYLHLKWKNMFPRAWFHPSGKIFMFLLREYFIFLEQRTGMGIILTQKEMSSYVTAACPFGIYFVVCTEHKMYSISTCFKQLIYLTGIDL
jgi:hypothetical protein